MKKVEKYPGAAKPAAGLRDAPATTRAGDEATSMVRTQIYLTRAEHDFVAAEASRRGESMASVVRGCIEDKMRLPDSAWTANPMLEPTPPDPRLELPEDTALNHDHYLYGAPRKYVKRRGQWVLADPGAER